MPSALETDLPDKRVAHGSKCITQLMCMEVEVGSNQHRRYARHSAMNKSRFTDLKLHQIHESIKRITLVNLNI